MQSHAPARGRHDISKIDKWGRKRSFFDDGSEGSQVGRQAGG